MINCWIIDDEPDAHAGLKVALETFKDFRITYQAYDGDDKSLTSFDPPDVIFLDIAMPGTSGFEFLRTFNSEDTLVVFVTAYSHCAVRAFDCEAFDYLMKPIEHVRFSKTINKVRQRITQNRLLRSNSASSKKGLEVRSTASELGLSVQTSDGLYYVKQRDIFYIEAVSEHLALYLKEKVLLTRCTFKRMSVDLDACFFHRTHKSYMVNIAHVKKFEKSRFGDGVLILSEGLQVKLSRRYKEVLIKLKEFQLESRLTEI